jgi:hypothetical protein
MKKTATLYGILTFVLLLPLAAMLGCGDDVEDECEDVCNKVDDCAAAINLDIDFGSCVDQCEDGSSGRRDCAFDCDRGLSCAEYGVCILGCGLIDEESAVESNCQDACTRADECANEIGVDVDIAGCTNDCIAEDDDTQGCVFLCDTGDSCPEFAGCLVPCGFI